MPNENITFINSVLAPLMVPDHPLKRKDWAGLSFDRNWHEDLAPTEIWQSLFAMHTRQHKGDVYLIVVDANQAERVEAFQPDLQAFRAKLDDGFGVLVAFYVLSPFEDWLVRIDYDVTLFCGNAALMRDVVNLAGGLDHVEAMMMEDFEGFEEYIRELVRPLTAL